MADGKLSTTLRGVPLDKKTAKGLKLLQQQIEKDQIAPSQLDRTLNLATWNIREFGKAKREDDTIHYIAEIIRQFDIVGIVELREDLTDLGRLMRLLGPSWDAIYSDCVEDRGGNQERFGFVFDNRSVTFNGLAGNQIWRRDKVKGEYVSKDSFWRMPYAASFSSGNFDFVVYCAHARWGSDKKQRQAEIARFAELIDFKADRAHAVDRDVILMGDFNTETPEMIEALTALGLCIPESIEDIKTNIKRTQRYDHILYYPQHTNNLSEYGGVIDFTAVWDDLFPGLTEQERTYKLSDHLPLWVQINTDNDIEVLDQIIKGKRKSYVVSD